MKGKSSQTDLYDEIGKYVESKYAYLSVEDREDMRSDVFLEMLELQEKEAYKHSSMCKSCDSFINKKMMQDINIVGITELHLGYVQDVSPIINSVDLELLESKCRLVSKKQKSVLRQHYGEGYSLDQIGNIYGVCGGTIGNWIHKALRKYREVARLSHSKCHYKDKSLEVSYLSTEEYL